MVFFPMIRLNCNFVTKKKQGELNGYYHGIMDKIRLPPKINSKQFIESSIECRDAFFKVKLKYKFKI